VTLLPTIVAALSFFAGQPVTATCEQSLPGTSFVPHPEGLAYIDEHRVELTNEVCHQVNWLAVRRRLPLPSKTGPGEWADERNGFAASLATVVHEAGHIRHPNWSEACVQRFAVLHVKAAAKRLRIRKADRREIYEDVRDEYLGAEYDWRSCLTAPPPYNPDRR